MPTPPAPMGVHRSTSTLNGHRESQCGSHEEAVLGGEVAPHCGIRLVVAYRARGERSGAGGLSCILESVSHLT